MNYIYYISDNMKKINICEYNKNMGLLIDVRHPIDYLKNHHPESININHEKLMYNPQKYLDKNQTYYITCLNGKNSSKVVAFLEYLKYNVVQVV